MDWLWNLFTEPSIAQAVVIYGLVIALGLWLGKIKTFIKLGVTWVLFLGIIFSYFGIAVNKEIEHFLKDFGLILFVYCLGLQVGPGFFASLKKTALVDNLLAAMVVILGVLTAVLFYYLSDFHISIVAGVMSGAVTNTPGLAAAQAAMADLNITDVNTSYITLAYALVYPFGVIGIILSLVILKKAFRTDIKAEQELHRKLKAIRSSKPGAFNIVVENNLLQDQPLRQVFSFLKERVVVSRMLHDGKVLVPTPDTKLSLGDVLLVVAPKSEITRIKLIIGSESNIDLKAETHDQLISRTIVVTNKEVTHQRLGDIAALHQRDFTLTRLNRAGIEMVPHGDMVLQLADTIKVVGTEDGVRLATAAVGNSLKRLDVPDLAPIFIGIVLGVIVGSIPFYIPNIPVPIKIGMAGGPLLVALLLSRFGGKLYLNNYTTSSANQMIRELGIALFLASVGLSSGEKLAEAFSNGGLQWILMGLGITLIPLLIVGFIARKFFRKTYFEVCGLLAGASTDPPALAFALKMAGNDIPSATYATVYPLTLILRILAAQLLILFLV
jgi:putative transport protein